MIMWIDNIDVFLDIMFIFSKKFIAKLDKNIAHNDVINDYY